MSHTYRTCQCGNKMANSANVCWDCYQSQRVKPEAYICTGCNGTKSFASNYCIKCTYKQQRSHNALGWERSDNLMFKGVNYETLTDSWLFQFAGIFHGEGSAILKFTNKGTVVAGLSMQLRSDDKPVLDSIANQLGGNVRLDRRSSRNLMAKWETTRNRHVFEICKLIVDYTILPAKKLKEVELVYDFCDWRFSQPFHSADWEYAKSLAFKLRDMRHFKVQDNG